MIAYKNVCPLSQKPPDTVEASCSSEQQLDTACGVQQIKRLIKVSL